MPTPTSLGKAATLGPRPRPARGQIWSPGGLVEALDAGWPPGPSRLRGEMTASSLSGPALPGDGPTPSPAIAVAERVRELSALDLGGLRLQWRNVFGRNAPAHLTKPLLSRILAYRLQSEAYGDLDSDVRRALKGVRRSAEAGADKSGSFGSARRIKPGSVLVREWGGQLHRVTALSEGFTWDGGTYRSLSHVARAITGVRWNGPKFFGLDRLAGNREGRSDRRPGVREANRRAAAPPPRSPRRGDAPSIPGCLLIMASIRTSTPWTPSARPARLTSKSQTQEGWGLVRTASTTAASRARASSALLSQRLLEAIRQRRIDVIVVYKVDRLTRSLADFAKLVELFDAHGVSFISITQSFNTTTSMGRLTLNMLLSFAQFEREVTGERIRDKIAASKKKGIWVGGVVPLGYRVEDRKLVVDEDEAANGAPDLRSLSVGGLDARPPAGAAMSGESSPASERCARAGSIGGIPFTKGPLGLSPQEPNVSRRDQSWPASYPGEHPGSSIATSSTRFRPASPRRPQQ